MSPTESERFTNLSRKIFDYEVSYDPIIATKMEIRDKDLELPESTEEAIKRDTEKFSTWKEELEGLDESLLSEEERVSRSVGVHYLQLKAFRLSVMCRWRHVPAAPFQIGAILHPLLTADASPGDEELENLRARLREIPEFMKRSEGLVSRPAGLWVQFSKEALDEVSDLLDSYRERIASAGSRPKKIRELDRALKEARRSFQEYRSWLEESPGINDGIAPDRAEFQELLRRKKIRYGIDEIVELGKEYLDRSRDQMERYAERVERELSSAAAMSRVEENRPSNFDEALSWYRKSVKEAKKYVEKRNILTLPENEDLVVKKTPSYLRGICPLGHYVAPAGLEDNGQGTYFVPPQRNPHGMKNFAFWSIRNTAVRETYPGRHVLRARANELGDPLLLSPSSTETLAGWSLYCEEMMRDYGFGDTPESRLIGGKRLRLTSARALVDVKLSTGQFSPTEGVNFLTDTTGISEEEAEGEVARWIISPGDLLSGLVGYHKIKEMRDDFKWGLGGDYSDRLFHDEFLSTGPAPLDLVQKRLEGFVARHNGGDDA